MQNLQLVAKTKEQEKVKAYLEENVSEVLAEKINKGIQIEKGGHPLLNIKTLDGFMKFACFTSFRITILSNFTYL